VEDSVPVRTHVSRKGAHRRCARCNKVVSRRTLVCRRCGKRQRIDPRALVMGCAGLFLIGIFAVATAGAQLPFPRLGRKAADASPSAPPASAGSAAQGPAIEAVTATELWGLYNLDPSRADARFKNRPVAVSGRVTEVRQDYHGNFIVRLGTDQPFDAVRATVMNRHDLGRSVPVVGQTVALNCTGHGALIGSPILDACDPI
jgi:hypothetical protein